MVDHAMPARAGMTAKQPLRVAGLPVGAILPRSGLHLIAVLLGIVLMLPF